MAYAGKRQHFSLQPWQGGTHMGPPVFACFGFRIHGVIEIYHSDGETKFPRERGLYHATRFPLCMKATLALERGLENIN